ncbi:DNA adenine methylase [Paenibacillus larvae]|uniref:DNA adenine methylase n=1 Tax=Paenibacillus larvae TaxID=1464 RepID=UPI00227E048F|nr:Dam family site-specific DNA-(adenine-N6)-methyltransferase [Paenibacillus larvae]MCY9747946.1 Dam family site-specific DNA-(adenine-N6)-methyltransferase [Paenibacillus larvae]MCY9750232.1 Dam family site-specific DNA-(adenine-N6)-methyltransferase [Paenibacillus larvae]
MRGFTAISTTKPFLRWVGGKTWLIKYLNKIIGDTKFKNYHEPFLGGGSIFFTISPKRSSYLSDINNELINTYQCIKDNPSAVIDMLRTYENTEVFYYKIRNQVSNDPIEQAARFIFLNQTSFNGLYRVNQRGEYNVPFGYRKKDFLEEEKLISASKCLQKATLICGDFTCNKFNIMEGDLVFLDPPYTVSHNNNGFIKYNQKLFSLNDQKRLSKFIDYIKSQGAYYILTNASHQTILELFDKGDLRLELSRSSLIGGSNAKREKVSEYIFTNVPGGQIDEHYGKVGF